MKRVKTNLPGRKTPAGSPALTVPKLPVLKNPSTSAGSMGAIRADGSRAQSFGTNTEASGINFGKGPHEPSTPVGSSSWKSFLSSTLQGGVMDFLNDSSGGLLGNFGLGSIISGMESLFQSKRAVTPIVKFSLPASQNETVTIGATTSSSSDVANAVKQAILQSSSLNDVIAEI